MGVARARWTAVAALLFGGVLGAGPGEATILTFDETRSSSAGNPVIPTVSGFAVPDDYGDRASGPSVAVPGGAFTYGEAGEGFTPDVVVDIFSGSASPSGPGTSLWETQYGDLLNVVFGNNGSQSLSVVLTADPGFDVLLYGFDLGGWPDTDYTVAGVRVRSGSTLLFADTDVLVEGDFTGPRHTSFAFATPLVGPQLAIEIDTSNLAAGQQDDIGIDNVRFGQTPPPVPEPGAGLLAGLGLGALALRGRARGAGRAPS